LGEKLIHGKDKADSKSFRQFPMSMLAVVAYLIVATLFFAVGRVTAQHEKIDFFFAFLMSMLWPVSAVAVAVHALHLKYATSNSLQNLELD
jgi:uncharacterized membrane protein SirB2